jgi:putative ABC transport system ATP-binding protein
MKAAATSTALSLTQVGVRYGEQNVLAGFSMAVATGEKVCLHGPSGCGKSTVLHCVLGFTVPHTGHIEIAKRPLAAQSVWTLRQHIAWVPQQPAWNGLTAREALRQPLGYHANRCLRGRGEHLEEWMDRFALPSALLDKRCSDLSGGEKQRVGLVAALLLDRPILLLDEVTAALDRANSERVRHELGTMAELTILAVSHDPEAESWAHRTVEMQVPTHA